MSQYLKPCLNCGGYARITVCGNYYRCPHCQKIFAAQPPPKP